MSSAEKECIPKNIVLVGMMGCGKSTIGRLLAKDMGSKFFDSDQIIEKNESMSIKKIFERHGEKYFRECEYNTIKDLIAKKEFCVIASGGGAFIHDITRDLIKNNALSIWLRSSYEVLLKRVSKSNKRPILENGDKEEILKSLIDVRYPIYSEADIHFQNNDIPNKILVRGILEYIKRVNK